MKRGPKGGILIFVENDPQGYKLSCCVSFGLVFFSVLFRLSLAILWGIVVVSLGKASYCRPLPKCKSWTIYWTFSLWLLNKSLNCIECGVLATFVLTLVIITTLFVIMSYVSKWS